MFARAQASVQGQIGKKSAPHKMVSDEFALRGVALCASCAKPLTAGFAKRKFLRHWCWNPKCTKKVGVSRETLENKFLGLLKRMEPNAKGLAVLP